MDEYSHHEQKKRDLQVSKKEGLARVSKRGRMKQRQGQGGVDKRKYIIVVYIHAYIYFYTLSTNNGALCLGSKVIKKSRLHAFNSLDPSSW